MNKSNFLKNNKKVIDWLLSFDNLPLKYRILSELLDYDKSEKEIVELKEKIPTSVPVQKIFSKMHPDGYWLQKKYTGEILGDGVEYGSFATTHFCLAYLAELGMTKEHPNIAKAAERYLNLQQDDGDWLWHFSCLNGYNIRNFIMLGYRDDPRLQKVIDLMLHIERFDGGYLCDWHEKKGKGKKKKSCIRGSAKMLIALAEIPEYFNHPRTLRLTEYFLNRGGIFSNKKPDKFVNRDIEVFSFPITWRTATWEILLALSKMGYGKDKRLKKAWSLIDEKQNKDGSYNLDYTPTKAPNKFGTRGEPSPWITFYILLAKKYAGI